ncbi:MAG TPA: tetratricopeptide repeat protein [Longimicrobiaceae bacterium]
MYVLTDFHALGMDGAAVWLWQALREVGDWHADPSCAARGGRRDFEGAEPGIRASLAALDRLLRDGEPDAATREAVAFACLNLATWAEERGAYATAVGFLHAAEAVCPDNPHYAYDLGRVARKMARYEEAEAWLKWAHFVARRLKRWEVATLSLSGLGNLHRQRGNLPRARRFHEVTRRMAAHRGLRTLEGDALYDLCVISFAMGDEAHALKYAGGALGAYGPGHGQVCRLANDVAWYWMDSSGNFEHAASVFTILLDYVWEPSYRVLLVANLARAAAGAGWRDVFEGMWIEAWGAIRNQSAREGHAAALIQLARGAGSVGDWERASLAAAEALAVGRNRKESEMVLLAEAILEALTDDVLLDERIRHVFKDRERTLRSGMTTAAGDLVSQFGIAMRARRDNAPESPTRALVWPD